MLYPHFVRVKSLSAARFVLLQWRSGMGRIAQICTSKMRYPPMNGAGQISLFCNNSSQWDHNVILWIERAKQTLHSSSRIAP